jgi:predicted AAA+ superfamily ATPase
VRVYIEHLKDAFIVEEAKRYDVKGRKYIGSPFKYYFCDMGLRNARMNFRQVEPTHAMENVVYNELRSRGFGVDVGLVTRYLRDESGRQSRNQLEIDFVCNKGDRRYYVQSAYSVPDGAKWEQESAPLSLVDDSFRKIVVVRDPVVPRHDDSGILVVGVHDFLLDSSLMDA